MDYFHVDVFSSQPLSGNGLTVVMHSENLDAHFMQQIAREFKQFETIFLRRTGEKSFRARIFTIEEELDFAGHPVLGAVSALHERFYPDEKCITITFDLNSKALETESARKEDFYQAAMNQGIPEYFGPVKKEQGQAILKALNLTEADLHPQLQMQVISTGLRYVIVPLSSGLEKAKISVDYFEVLLQNEGAKFVYLFDVSAMEGRTWDNSGVTEDVATGSAAGPVGAYLYKRNICKASEKIVINQGRFTGRPSRINVYTDVLTGEIHVAGDVRIIAKGELMPAI